MQYKLININTHRVDDPSLGSLSVFEGMRDIPFEIRRFWYMNGARGDGSSAGYANKTLWQMLFCPYGSIRIGMDDGTQTAEVVLDDPSVGLLIGPGVWHTMDWLQDDSVLCVAASAPYDEGDYLRDYEQFLRYVWENRESPKENG